MQFDLPYYSNIRDGEHLEPYPPRQNYHADSAYVHSSDVRVSSAFADGHGMIPRGPPPPYNAYDVHPRDVYDRQRDRTAGSQQYSYEPRHAGGHRPHHVSYDPLPGKRVSSRSSSANLGPYRQEQGRQSSASLLNRPSPSVFSDCPVTRSIIQSAALCDRVAAKAYDVLARLDGEDSDYESVVDRIKDTSLKETKPKDPGHGKKNEEQSRPIVDFKKTWMYANSRLPPGLLPMKLYMATWQIVCMAAQASSDVYRRPRGDEREDYIEADWRQGTKAMLIHSRPVDDKNLIVLAIRGSKWNLADWAVNIRPAPSFGTGFLDDEGNACHAGFLQVARAMITPIAARLRDLLEQDPSRASSSLLLTGHSAGGAVASLLYMHMMANYIESELNILTGCFKRVHCVTFGTPPLTILPLQNAPRSKNVFLSIANEGDPVVRSTNRQYIKMLTKIITAPSPLTSWNSSHQSRELRKCESRQTLSSGRSRYKPPRWEVPPATLSNAGRIVLIREKPGHKRAVEAVQVTDEELRGVIFGDPAMHHMELYKSRIDELAIAAVTGR